MAKDREIIVDLWKTGAHSINVGIHQDQQHQAKSRQFTKDTEIIGDVEERDEEAGYVTYREDPWKEDIPTKRIIIKDFTKSMNWRGSLEELLARGIAQSISADKALPSFIINLSKSQYLIPLEKVQRHGTLGKQIYCFIIVDSETNESFPFSVEADRMSLGGDWEVFDHYREKIADIDGSKFNVGGKYTIKIKTDAPTYRNELPEVLILFSTLLKFLEDVEKKLEESIKKIKKEKLKITLDQQEAVLYNNPRLVKM